MTRVKLMRFETVINLTKYLILQRKIDKNVKVEAF